MRVFVGLIVLGIIINIITVILFTKYDLDRGLDFTLKDLLLAIVLCVGIPYFLGFVYMNQNFTDVTIIKGRRK